MADSALPPMATAIQFNEAQLDVSSLKGRSVLITGGASGIGLACATKIAEAGALVTISDLQQTVGQTAAQELASKGHGVQFVQCDVTSYAAQVDMFRKAIAFGGGKIDIVIPNAGIIAEKNLFDMVPDNAPFLESPPPPEPSYAGCHVNLQAVYNTCYLAMHYFRLPRDTADTYKPSIVLIASLAGYVGYPSSSTYSMSKFGIRGLFYGIRDRASRETPAVRVNLVAPWYIKTAMTQASEFLASEAGLLLNVMGFAPMERVLSAVLQFCADERLHGRAAGIFPLANEDLGDDLEGAYSGKVLQKHMKDVMIKVTKAMANMEAQKNELTRQDSATGAPTGVGTQ
jgi:5'-hydroxyaverantin dehydrogenase